MPGAESGVLPGVVLRPGLNCGLKNIGGLCKAMPVSRGVNTILSP